MRDASGKQRMQARPLAASLSLGMQASGPELWYSGDHGARKTNLQVELSTQVITACCRVSEIYGIRDYAKDRKVPLKPCVNQGQKVRDIGTLDRLEA